MSIRSMRNTAAKSAIKRVLRRPYQSGERQLPHEQLRRALVLPDLSQCPDAWPSPLLRTFIWCSCCECKNEGLVGKPRCTRGMTSQNDETYPFSFSESLSVLRFVGASMKQEKQDQLDRTRVIHSVLLSPLTLLGRARASNDTRAAGLLHACHGGCTEPEGRFLWPPASCFLNLSWTCVGMMR